MSYWTTNSGMRIIHLEVEKKMKKRGMKSLLIYKIEERQMDQPKIKRTKMRRKTTTHKEKRIRKNKLRMNKESLLKSRKNRTTSLLIKISM